MSAALEPRDGTGPGAAPRAGGLSPRLLAILGLGALALALIAGTAHAQEIAFFGDVLWLLTVVSTACAWVGAWLVLRRMSMTADAIGHAILFGIVVVLLLLVRLGVPALDNLSSPWFVLGASFAGLLTVFLTESLVRTRLVREDASIGMVFSFLFALALVLIALFFRDAHVDEHLVLAGGVEITVLRPWILSWTLPGWLTPILGGVLQAAAPEEAVRVTREGVMTIEGWSLGPRSLWTMGAILLADLAFVGLLWKELKLSTFDAGLAASLGFAPAALNYALAGMVSVTAVGAFEAMGAIIVIALFIAPPATAYLLTDDLLEMAALSVVVALLASWLGFQAGAALDINFGASVAVACGLLFGLALLFAPGQGLISQGLRRRAQRRSFATDLLLVHLSHHEGKPEAAEETALDHLPVHLRWTREETARIARRAVARDLVEIRDGRLYLREAGRRRAAAALARGQGAA